MQTPAKDALRSMPDRRSSSRLSIATLLLRASYVILSFDPGIAVDHSGDLRITLAPSRRSSEKNGPTRRRSSEAMAVGDTPQTMPPVKLCYLSLS